MLLKIPFDKQPLNGSFSHTGRMTNMAKTAKKKKKNKNKKKIKIKNRRRSYRPAAGKTRDARGGIERKKKRSVKPRYAARFLHKTRQIFQ